MEELEQDPRNNVYAIFEIAVVNTCLSDVRFVPRLADVRGHLVAKMPD